MFTYNGIAVGDKVHLHFAGGPSNMPEPWIVTHIDYKFSTVSYSHHPSLTIRAANGVEETFDHAEIYSPRKVKQS
jgi:hypothetical protein